MFVPFSCTKVPITVKCYYVITTAFLECHYFFVFFANVNIYHPHIYVFFFDIDKCRQFLEYVHSSMPKSSRCQHLPLHWKGACPSGFKLQLDSGDEELAKKCIDVGECAMGSFDCNLPEVCENFINSYT